MVDITGNEFFEKVCENKAKHMNKIGRARKPRAILKISVGLFLLCMFINIVLIYNFFEIIGKL